MTTVNSSVVGNFEQLPKSSQNAIKKLLSQIETTISPEKRETYDRLVTFMVGLNPTEYVDGDLSARHLAAQIMTFFDVTVKK